MVVSGQAVRPHPARAGLLAAVDAEAAEWGVGVILARVAFAAPLLGVAAVLAVRPDRDLFDFLTREDSIFEWTQFAGYSLAVVLGLAAARRVAAAGAPWLARAFLVFAGANTFIAGEEISWGQRLFGWGTPAAIDNQQHETTIHNVKHVLSLFNLAMLTIGLVGFAVPWLLRRPTSREVPAWLRAVAPPLFLTSAFFVLFGYKLARFAAFQQPTFTAERFGEWAELCLALALSSYAFLVWRTAPTRVAAAVTTAPAVSLHFRPRVVAAAAGTVALVAIAAVGLYELGERHTREGTLSRAALAGVQSGMSQSQVRSLIGPPLTKCWYYDSATLCFDRSGSLKSTAGAGRLARVTRGSGEDEVRAMAGQPPRKCWFYRLRAAREQLCFAGERLVSKKRL